ncbi:ABC transporter permease [Streptomyces subrutilus]|uniref:ABC transporter permease n=1 Tax=Streptomyces subrutilus TaxID=36818 RepID=A0A5P2UQS2_9ACTN|nr:ABC transporter permease [Streptomyces subrutilus]QEU79941.1 ABC transporter permease [Streptomyces subrutilus]WSJ30796.1 ABC transporter permease [Streptomyces subrutilus]GGZ91036.1 transport permease protein [Streptomyces subrutilus]
MTALSLKPARLAALGRSELTLLVRNRAALSVALLLPLVMVFVLRSTLTGPQDAAALGEATLTGGIGMVLVLVVYMNLVSAYVARREELVLKRLRTGEARDLEILAGTALPATVLALGQIAVLVAAGAAALDVRLPRNPPLVLAAVLAGILLLAGLSALTSSFTRNVESAGITTLPLFLLTALGSGLFLPVDALPDALVPVCELLPLSGVMTLVRAGWSGGAQGGDLLAAGLTTLAWAGITVFAVQRWFRWEPRR